MTEASFAQIRRLSRWLQIGVTLAMLILPLGVALGMAMTLADPYSLAQHFPGLPEGTAPTRLTATLALLIGASMLIPALFALSQMRRLFARYLAGEVLSPACAQHIRRIGLCFVALAGMGVMMPTLQILVLTATNPAGQRALSIAISSDSIGFLLAGGLLTVIGHSMVEAARAAEENAGFI